MNLSELIHEWIHHEGSFIDGIRLLHLTGRPVAHFEAQLERPYVDPNQKQALAQQLRQYLQLNPPSKIIPAQPDEMLVEEPAAIQDLRRQAIPFHKRYSHLKAQLYQMSIETDKYSDADRYEIAKEIMEEVLPKTDAIYDQIRSWEETGDLPPEQNDELVRQTVEKMQRIQSLRPRISRLNKMLAGKLSNTKRKQYEKELIDKEIELKELENELGLNS